MNQLPDAASDCLTCQELQEIYGKRSKEFVKLDRAKVPEAGM